MLLNGKIINKIIMKDFWAYLRLIRITNLIIIVLTQYFFRHFIIIPLYKLENVVPPSGEIYFLFLVLSTVFIAAAGYAINDYFDMRIDRINKPDKMLLGKIIPRRMAILIHGIFTGAGILCSFIAAFMIGSWKLGFISIIIAFTLWQYSHKFKAAFITGNFIIALSSAFVVFIVWLFEIYAQMNSGQAIIIGVKFFYFFAFAYAIFAFLTSIIREIIKDIEDIEGDRKVGCKTIPIKLGTKKAKIIINLFVAVSIMFILLIMFKLSFFPKFNLLLYYLGLLIALFVYLLFMLFKATEKSDFSFLSLYLKIIMFAGLLSMQLIFILI